MDNRSGGFCESLVYCLDLLPQHLSISLTDPAATVTPLPGALPLFASGIGGLGFFNWRRRR